MKTFKLIDFWIQAVLIPGGIVFALVNHNYFLYSYLVVGGWQFTSCIIHEFFKGSYYRDSGRRAYLITTLIVLSLGLILFLALTWFGFFVSLIYAFLLLIFTPMIAIWYVSICNAENKMLRHKALVHLK